MQLPSLKVFYKKGNLAGTGRVITITETDFDPEKHTLADQPEKKVESMPKSPSKNKTKAYEPKVNTK